MLFVISIFLNVVFFFSIHELMELGVSGRFASISRTDKDSSINLKVDQLT